MKGMLLLSMLDVNGSFLHISKNSKQAFFSHKVGQNQVIKAVHVKLSVLYFLLFLITVDIPTILDGQFA